MQDASATVIDVPLENAIISVLCEWLGFSFDVNNISTLMFSFSAVF